MAKPGDYNFYIDVALKPGADIEKVYESEHVLAFHHTKPYYEKHVVVIPKKHVHDLRHLEDDSILLELLQVARDILKSIPESFIEEEGAQLATNFGANQDSPHLHFYVVAGKKLR